MWCAGCGIIFKKVKTIGAVLHHRFDLAADHDVAGTDVYLFKSVARAHFLSSHVSSGKVALFQGPELSRPVEQDFVLPDSHDEC